MQIKKISKPPFSPKCIKKLFGKPVNHVHLGLAGGKGGGGGGEGGEGKVGLHIIIFLFIFGGGIPISTHTES